MRFVPERVAPFEVLFNATRLKWLVLDANGFSEHDTLREAEQHREMLEQMLERAGVPGGVRGMSGQHTPGPWVFSEVTDFRDPDDLGPVFTVGPSAWETVADVRPGNTDDGLPEQTPANARLIAAAPDLLEALEDAGEALELALSRLGVCGQGDSSDHRADTDSFGGIAALERARAAIAKAKGAPT